MGGERSEACGRCSMTSVVDMSQSEENEDRGGRDPFGDARIEVAEGEMRKASPHVVALGAVKRRLDEFMTRITYGR